jgi:diaminopimelate epimerase
MVMGKIPFLKMHGLGNDFVVIDRRHNRAAIDAVAARALADRRTGIGCDQVITLEPSRRVGAHLRMRILNADGSEAEACGNAARCIAALMHQETGKTRIGIETVAGLIEAEIDANGSITADMGPARCRWDEVPLAEAMDTDRVAIEFGPLSHPVCTNIGNPHATFFVEDADAVDLAAIGPLIERDPLFPQRVNVGVATVCNRGVIRLRVWERGAGITSACGSAACAALVAAVRRGLSGRQARIVLDGGCLDIGWRGDGHVLMTGPASLSFEGAFDEALLSRG